jgi:hypothetical protein
MLCSRICCKKAMRKTPLTASFGATLSYFIRKLSKKNLF